MSKKEKLIQRLRSKPRDFTFEECETLLSLLSFVPSNKGKTSGSRISFENMQLDIKVIMHKPHPRKELPEYQIKQLIEELEQEGLI